MKRVLEIGGGMTPYFVRYDIPWNEANEYVCVDVNEKNIEGTKEAIQRLKDGGAPHPQTAHFLVQDAIRLPIDDQSVDEIVFSNVLSAPIHNNWNSDGTEVSLENEGGEIKRSIMGSKEDGDLFYRERKPLVEEALRVLRKGGTLSVYTDLIVYGMHSYMRILEELVEHSDFDFHVDEAEGERIDQRNIDKMNSPDYCYCFTAEVLPKSSVFRFQKSKL